MDLLMFLVLGVGFLLKHYGPEKAKPLASVFVKRWGFGLFMMILAVGIGHILMPDGIDDERMVSLLFVGAIVLVGMTTMLWALCRFALDYYFPSKKTD